MKKRISALLLALAMVAGMVAPALSTDSYAAENTAVYEYEEAAVVNPVSNSWHEATATTGDIPPWVPSQTVIISSTPSAMA